MSEVTEGIGILIRWVHSMATISWLGAMIVTLVLQQAQLEKGSGTAALLDRVMRDLTDVAVPAFLLTGAILTFDRFARGVPGPAYIAALSAKLVLAFGMFHLGYRSRRTGLSASPAITRNLCVMGGAIVLLATILKAMSGVDQS